MQFFKIIKKSFIRILFIILLLSIFWFGCMPPNLGNSDSGGSSSGGGGNGSSDISSGTFLWSKRLGGIGIDMGGAITIDASNNIIVTGHVYGNADLNGDGVISAFLPETATSTYGSYDIFISKFYSSGTYGYQRLGGTDFDGGLGIKIDTSNNIIVTGDITGNADLNGDGVISAGLPETATSTYGNSDIFISKFNLYGGYYWTKRLGGTNSDSGSTVTINASDKVIVTGSVTGNADLNGDGAITAGFLPETTTSTYGNSDIFISVFNSSGTFGWSKRLGGTDDDRGRAITIDASNNIIITGCVHGNADLNGNGIISTGLPETTTSTYGSYDIFISVFNSSGTFDWAKRLGGTGGDEGYGIITDASNNIIVTGCVHGNADLNGDGVISTGLPETVTSTYGDGDIFISKFNSSGSCSWSKRLGGTNVNGGSGLITDMDDNIFVLGTSYGDADLNGDGDYNDGGESAVGYGELDIFIVKFSSDGTYQWSKRLGGIGIDEGCGITIDTSNNIIVTGYVYGNADLNGDGIAESTGYGSSDIFIAKFTN